MRGQVRGSLFDVAVNLLEKFAGQPLEGETRIWVLVSTVAARDRAIDKVAE